MQDIGSAQAHDKKTAKKEAAQKAVDFLLQLGTRSRSASATQSDASQPSTSGLHAALQNGTI